MKILRNIALCIPLALLLILPGSQSACHAAADYAAPAAAAHMQQTAAGEIACTPLFPAIETEEITQLCVTTPTGRFEFLCADAQKVSLNGRKADEEIFATLLSQIAELPVHALSPFMPSSEPVMTLSIRMRDGARHTALFYDDGGPGRKAHISSTSSHASAYHATDAWRVGTLLLTCEGTRIQDENGREAPAD